MAFAKSLAAFEALYSDKGFNFSSNTVTSILPIDNDKDDDKDDDDKDDDDKEDDDNNNDEGNKNDDDTYSFTIS